VSILPGNHLTFVAIPGEAVGEEVYEAKAQGYRFVINREPHRTDWTWIVLRDVEPVDLGASVPTKEAAIAACNEWLEGTF
jgi:hypothetical protein